MSPAEPLTPRQERDLALAAEAGDAEASRRLVDAFLPAIAAVARRYPAGTGFERRDLVQEGVAGLLLAARRYDSGLDTPFWAYAAFWVRKAIQELIADLARPVALSDRAVRKVARIREARREHVRVHHVEPTSDELSRATGLTRTQLDDLQATERTPCGLEQRLTTDGGTTTVADTIVDPAADQAYERMLGEFERRLVRDLTDRLDERERAVIVAHYGLGQTAQTLGQIGRSLGLTAERARQIEAAALVKLRTSLARSALP